MDAATADLNKKLLLSEKRVAVPTDTPTVRGYDFNKGVNYDELFASFRTTGLQASSLGAAIDTINKMLRWRLSDEPKRAGEPDKDRHGKPLDRSKVKCTIFLGYTSNMVSSGVRESIRFLAQHSLVQCIVTTTGGIEEDFMKCMSPFYMGDFKLPGATLRRKGLNRIGNMLVPNKSYCELEAWMNPILDQMLKEQKEQGVVWTPSSFIARLGKEINNPDSVYYWAWKNNIPVFCPAMTDGALGDLLYFHSINNPGLIIDIAGDVRRLNDMAVNAPKTGMIVLGGGVAKHHICNANLMRNGADYSVFINTGAGWDGSDSGAHPDEAISWGKIALDATPVKVYGDASIMFPLIVAQTFAKAVHGPTGKPGPSSPPRATAPPPELPPAALPTCYASFGDDWAS